MNTLPAFFDAAVPDEVSETPPQEICDVCHKPGKCYEIMGDFVCEECNGPRPESATMKDVAGFVLRLDWLTKAALLALAAICGQILLS